MADYIPIICFIAGLVAGAVLHHIGFKLGFRASYEIRQSKDYPEEGGKGLLGKKKEPPEFELLKGEQDAN